METVGKEEKGKNSRMVNISLPLLFAEGKPTSLERMTIGQMEKFIPFLLSCCPAASRETPVWWPRSIPFQFPLCSTGTLVEWEAILRQTIVKCYEHHNCTHLLRFCRRLSELPEHLLMYKENSQGFISIINSSNKKLIVTYKKKNETYDRPHSSPFKSLLPKKRKPPPQQPIIEDIYLCNYCDGEFFSCREIVAHEGVCSGKIDDDGMGAHDQVSAMKYFMLQPRTLTAATPVRRCTSLKLTAKSYMQVPISSPLGHKMFANVCPLNNEDKMICLNRIENLCKKQQDNESFYKKKRSSAYAFRYVPKRKPMIWSHSYTFNKAQRNEKLLTLKTGLNKKARMMLQKCKEAIVLVERLPLLDPLALHAAASLNFPIHFPGDDSKERVSEVPLPEPSRTICIDLTCDDESSANEYSNSSSDTFFLTSTSNHKIPSVEDWMPLFPKPLVHV